MLVYAYCSHVTFGGEGEVFVPLKILTINSKNLSNKKLSRNALLKMYVNSANKIYDVLQIFCCFLFRGKKGFLFLLNFQILELIFVLIDKIQRQFSRPGFPFFGSVLFFNYTCFGCVI